MPSDPGSISEGATMRIQEWIAMVGFLLGTLIFFAWVLRLWLKK
jgi:hypothetical protein